MVEHNIQVDLGSDQTSLHNPWAGGYYPVGLTFEESQKMMAEDPEQFKEKVQESLRRHVAAVNKLSERAKQQADLTRPTQAAFAFKKYFS